MWLTLVALWLQAPDPAYAPLARAYEALKNKDYSIAVSAFQEAIALAPARPAPRKDLAYTYLKIGETGAAREQFGEAARLDPADFHTALEYAFLCAEAREQVNTRKAEARRIFEKMRQEGDAASRQTAAQAFENIDAALTTGISRWRKALLADPDNYSAHYELATLLEQQDELEPASQHYARALAIRPAQKSLFLDLGRVWKTLGQVDRANAALLAASRGGEPRAAEAARELLPARYPFVYEFEKALELDPSNGELRRELAYLHLRMSNAGDAERQFRIILQQNPEDLLSAAQLGFLLLARNDLTAAMPLLERVLAGKDEDLANRARAVLHLPQTLRPRPPVSRAALSLEARVMAERSIQAGYMKDALRYLTIAHESDPIDFEVMLKLGWTHNLLKSDRDAFRWFALARKSPDPKIAGDAAHAYANLRPAMARVRTSVWFAPSFSSRWQDVFTYGQIKTDLKLDGLPLRPYVSTRLVGDARSATSPALNFSESALILAVGVATNPSHGVMAWAEAGNAIGYLSGRKLPDYRGGVALVRGFGAPLFYEVNADAVYISRLGSDTFGVWQNRVGYSFRETPLRVFLNGNLTVDARRQYWANFVEFGPGLRLQLAGPLQFHLSLVRGRYLPNRFNPRSPDYFDLRAGFWYALTR